MKNNKFKQHKYIPGGLIISAHENVCHINIKCNKKLKLYINYFQCLQTIINHNNVVCRLQSGQ